MYQCLKRATYHYYMIHWFSISRPLMCVNALSGLHIISTEEWRYTYYVYEECQCSKRASYHFYMTWAFYALFFAIGVCQCPKRASYHFYEAGDIIILNDSLTCVNALSGLHIISTATKKQDKPPSVIVSMP